MNRISQNEYATAVMACVEVAKQTTGGGRAVAQVLLSAYNGNRFQLDVTDLCNLDNESYLYALAVIRGRYEVGCEPHEMIPNGSSVFGLLWNQWLSLDLQERAKKRCPDCYDGKIYKNDDDETGDNCPRCAGTGRVCRCT